MSILNSTSLGTWALAGDGPWGYGPCPPHALAETLNAALKLGVRHIDTAALFADGAVETALGEQLGARSDVQITTRIGCKRVNGHPRADFSAAAIDAGITASARRLQRPVLDRVLLHTPSIGVLRNREAMRTLRHAKADGRVREIGASLFEPEEALLALDQGADWVCLPYNLLNRRAEAQVMAAVREAGAKLMVREVLHNGLLTDQPRTGYSQFDVRREWPPYLLKKLQNACEKIAAARPGHSITQSAIGFALGSSVDQVVIGCRSPQQVNIAFDPALAPLLGTARDELLAALYSSR